MMDYDNACQGHLIYRNDRCQGCMPDDKNKFCSDYKSIKDFKPPIIVRLEIVDRSEE